MFEMQTKRSKTKAKSVGNISFEVYPQDVKRDSSLKDSDSQKMIVINKNSSMSTHKKIATSTQAFPGEIQQN